MTDTRNRLINAAYNEIYQKGYQGASVSAILKMAGIPKGSLYHHFSSKKQLALSVIKEKIEPAIHNMWQPILNKDNSIIAAIMDTITVAGNYKFPQGCPLNRLILEMAHIDNDFRILLTDIHKTCVQTVKTALDRAQSLGEIDVEDSRGLAIFILSALKGSLGNLNSHYGQRDFQLSITHLKNYLLSMRKTTKILVNT